MLGIVGRNTYVSKRHCELFKSAAEPLTLKLTTPSTVITSPDFHPGAVYRINVDNDGDAHADVAFTFTKPDNGAQTGTVYYATGAQACQPGPVGQVLTSSLPVSFDGMAQPVQAGGIRLFAGGAATRSSPISKAPCADSPDQGR